MSRGRHGGGRRSWHLRGRAGVSNPCTQSEICDQHSAAIKSVIVSHSRHSQAFINLVLQDKATAVYLHDKGADQDKQDYIGFTPLLDAIEEDPLSTPICTYLLLCSMLHPKEYIGRQLHVGASCRKSGIMQLQAFFLVLDDIMDDSHTRRGQPCWFRVPWVGFTAVNDGIMLRNHISRILRLHFRNKPYYADLLGLFNEVEFKTASGQMLDLITTHKGEKDDCLDCYGDPEFIGKIGTDIEDYKCSWLVVQALERADESQKSILFKNYGKKDPACVAKVKNIYKELNLEPNNVSTNLAMAIDLCEASTKADRYGVTQIFVDVYGFSMSLQLDLNQSVKSFIDFALEKAKFRARDFYATCCGKILYYEKLLGYYAIRKDSTIKLKHRLRGGVRHRTIRFKTWDEMVTEEPRFYVTNLSPCLVDPTQNLQSARFLSPHLQYHTREVLITMCRKHKRGISFNGMFTSSQILFHDGKAFFSDEVTEESATRDSFRADYDRICSIMAVAFCDSNNTFPIHVIHLLNFLWSPLDTIQLDSDLVIAFITNHPAIIPFDERIKICTLLDGLLERLPSCSYGKIINNIQKTGWENVVQSVPEMIKVYVYHARYDQHGNLIVPYNSHMGCCIHFCNNFFKHAPLNLNLEEIEASFSLAMDHDNVLPRILQNLAEGINDLPSDFLKYMLTILGNNLVGLKDA